MNITAKRAAEQRLLSEMIALYCRKRHRPPAGLLCPACAGLLDYAVQRSALCPRMESKTFCSACPKPCYRPAMRQAMRTVMRWAGPRMLLKHPVLSARHIKLTLQNKKR
jgi:hypothetical protein